MIKTINIHTLVMAMRRVANEFIHGIYVIVVSQSCTMYSDE